MLQCCLYVYVFVQRAKVADTLTTTASRMAEGTHMLHSKCKNSLLIMSFHENCIISL